jgi:hypothetical protein
MKDEPKQNSGCERCWPSNADAAWEASRALTFVQHLISESHFIVSIRACACCNQRFISVFTEMIDWEGGDDPQYWTLMPITETEAAELAQQRDSLTESSLEALGRDRRSMQHDHPKATAPETYWRGGIGGIRHD